jgi:hypothetical protein
VSGCVGLLVFSWVGSPCPWVCVCVFMGVGVSKSVGGGCGCLCAGLGCWFASCLRFLARFGLGGKW